MGGIIDLGTGLFGKSQTQDTLGSSTGTTTGTTAQALQGLITGSQQAKFRPEDLAALRAQQAQAQQSTQGVSNLAQQLQAQALQAQPQLNAQFGQAAQIREFQPQFGKELDPLSQALVAQGQQALQQRAGQQRQAIAQRFASRPGVAQALQQRADIQSLAQQNPLQFQAAQQQAQRELGQQGLNLRAAQSVNQARLNQAAQGAQFQQADNQALLQQAGLGQAQRAEAMGFGQAGLGAQSGLLGQILDIGRTLAESQSRQATQQNINKTVDQKTTQQQQQSSAGRSGGLFAK